LKQTLMCLKWSLLVMSVTPGWVVSEVISSKDQQTGLRIWEWKQEGISIQLVQRSPDQTRAFFQGRGFSSADADSIARACVFQTIFRNDGNVPVAYDLDAWHITHQGKSLPLQTRERWGQRWQSAKVPKGARIAFRWSLLPTRQRFEPGDYNWGMTSFGLPPGASFDLMLELVIDGKAVEARIPSIACAADQP